MSPTKYSFKRHPVLQHKPTASPFFHRYGAPLPAPTALTCWHHREGELNLLCKLIRHPSQAGGEQSSLQASHPCLLPPHCSPSLHINGIQPFSPAAFSLEASWPSMSFWGSRQREDPSQPLVKEAHTGCRGGCHRLHVFVGEEDCLKQVLLLSLSAR